MILSEVRDYLAEKGCVPLAELSRRFEVDEPALRGMLEVWVRRDKLRILQTGSSCGGCAGCGPAGSREICEWIGN